MSVEFNPQQKKIIAAGITTAAAGVILLAMLLLILLLIRIFSTFDHVFLPLAVAGVIAMVVKPLYMWLCTRAKLPAPLALCTLFLIIGLPFVGALTLFGTLIVTQLNGLIDQLPVLLDSLTDWFEKHRPELSYLWNEHPVGAKIKETLSQPGGPLIQISSFFLNSLVTAGASVANIFVSLFGWVITPVYVAFFLILSMPNARDVSSVTMPFFKEETRDDITFLAREFLNLVVTFFRGQLLIALIQGILFAIGFSLIGLQYGVVLGLTLGFLNIIPYLGSALGLAVCLPLAYLQVGGGVQELLFVIGVFTVVQAIEGYFLTPKIMGDKTGLHPLAIIVAIFFWGAALDGILGMILAIPLTAFLVVFWRLAREKYIKEIF
ncbi:MAG: AI-2E family transporter [marine bacterium B5-7]|nr:MAG: AI-2E family transporter [marine bacterium B5-7]